MGFIISKKNIIEKFFSYILIFISGIIIIGIEIIINAWGYEVIINNISDVIKLATHINFLIYGNINPNMSQEPIYWYLLKILSDFLPPTSILIIVSMIFIWIKRPKSLITFVTLPFFLIHCYIGHKELRYIFPVLAFTPYFISFFLDKIDNYILKKKYIIKIFYFLFMINLISLIYVSVTSQKNQLNILKKIVNNKNINEIYFINDNDYIKKYESLNPFNLKNITLNYYFHFKNIELREQIDNKNDLLVYRGFCRSGYSIGACIKKEQEKLKQIIYFIN